MGAGMSDATETTEATETSEAKLHAIGEIARRAGVTTRTLRYYQEMGLLHPSGVTRRGNRLYSDDDVDRLKHILELRDVMGFDLERIRLLLETEDRLAELRAESERGVSVTRRREMVKEAMELNARVRYEVEEKLGLLQGFLAELHAKASRYRDIADEIGLGERGDGAQHSPR
jgi:DNA-binding transcriptional MerR regulator